MLVNRHIEKQDVSFWLKLILPGDSAVTASFLFFFVVFRGVSSVVVPSDGASVFFFCFFLGLLSAGSSKHSSSSPFEVTVKHIASKEILPDQHNNVERAVSIYDVIHGEAHWGFE